MIEPHEMEWLKSIRASRPGPEPFPGPDCPGGDVLAALAEGTLDPGDHAACIAHLAACDYCRAAVAAVARALADSRVAREADAVERAGRPRNRRRGLVGVAVAAAAVLLLAILPTRLGEEAPDVHRAPAITAAAAPEAVSPVGAVRDARSFRWTSVAGAERYRVTMFDRDGSVRYETELTGTTVALPDSVRVARGETLWWKVDARVGFDRWVASRLIEFSLDAGAP